MSAHAGDSGSTAYTALKDYDDNDADTSGNPPSPPTPDPTRQREDLLVGIAVSQFHLRDYLYRHGQWRRYNVGHTRNHGSPRRGGVGIDPL
ncbi:hypothetical protein MED297_19922 [Reinekea sp. MED297]|uniref:Uncharacterized protein n=2 Tax=Reinekea TaxID=230494 RepID=A4B989_9GAMM|nr:hypothetical protein MED297_19922 [Reinekea sp. MED297] [Reinekea blandensis MED297]